MGKGFKIPEILNASLTDLLHDALESLRPRHPIHVTALLNDAVATLLSHAFIRPTTRMGLICGTGTNATCLCPAPYLSETKYAHEEDSGTNAWEEFVLVNTEWSMFGRGYLPTTKYDRIVDEESGLPGFQPFEMMVSGRYMGEIIRLVCMDGIDDGAWSFDKAPEAWTAKWTVQTADCSKVESYGFNYKRTIALLNDRFPLHSGSYTTSDADLFKQICNAVSTRSASLVAASTIALLQVNNELTKYPTNNWTCPTNSTTGTPSPSDSGLGSLDDDFRWSRRGSIFSVQGSRRGSLASPIVATTQPHLGSGLVTELHRGENGNASMTIMRENGIVVEEPSAMDLDDPDDDEVVVAFCGSVMEKYHNFRARCQAILDELVATHSRPSSSSSDEGIVSGKVSVDTGSIIEQRRVVLEENGDGGILGAGILAAVMDTQAHTSS
jgi:hexokinase